MPKTRRETKDLGMETCSGEGVVKKEKFPHNRNPSHRWICGEFWNLRGQHNWEGKKKTKTEYMPNHNCQQRVSPEAHNCYQQVGAGQAQAASSDLRVRPRLECPKNNLRALT